MTAAPGALVKFLEQMKAATGIDIEKRLQEISDMPDEEKTTPGTEPITPPASHSKTKSGPKEEE